MECLIGFSVMKRWIHGTQAVFNGIVLLSSNIANIFDDCVATNKLLLGIFTGLLYNRLHCISGWNDTGEQDEIYSEFQVDRHLARKHSEVKLYTEIIVRHWS